MTRSTLKRCVTASVIAIGAFFLGTNWLAYPVSARGEDPGQQAAAPTPTAEKPAEQAFKNIKALNGLPESQLAPVMNMISASLGVQCIQCHVKNGDVWEFDKDDKKAKLTARKMIQMTMDINKTSFEGHIDVSCYTCHQGHGRPVPVPSLPRPMPPANAAAPGGARPPEQPQINPQEVLAKYSKAVGAKEAIDKIKTRELKGTHVAANGMNLEFEIKLVLPDKVAVLVTAPQGAIAQGVSGDSGWVKNPREQRAMNNTELARARSLIWSLDPLPIKEPYPRMLFAGTEKIGDKETIRLRMNTPDKRRAVLYFDKESGLLLRRVLYTDTPVGSDPEQIDFEDYRDEDGVKIPHTIRVSYLDNFSTATRKITDMKTNVKVDDSAFAAPAAK
ncbi:MAG: c-type cytochrome [Blastocatellia bacterium AA13]|nr:MAG: c-type cytochrome [Blastocatellia bacterium AA13]